LPNAFPSIATGEQSGVVVLDIDVRTEGNGWDTLDTLGVSHHPETPTAHSPRGGCHLLFAWPGHHVKTIAGGLGPYLDIRGDGGSVILPPGPGRYWDPHLGPDTSLALMPDWMIIAEPTRPAADQRPIIKQRVSRYAERRLDKAVENILNAPDGAQRDTLNREVYAVARLVAGGELPSALALEALQWSSRQMVSHDPRRPWRDTDKLVNVAFLDGLRHPRRLQVRR
jgi:putative DNA primase/helicase